MKCDEKGQKVKSYFGGFLSENRQAMDMSVYDIGYTLGVSHTTVWCWEKGLSFPKSIILLKKLAVVFDEVPTVVKNLISMSGVAPSKSEWKRFEREIFSKTGSLTSMIHPDYLSKDKRDTDYKEAFGRYLRRERQDREIPYATMAGVFDVTNNTYCKWEAGSAFPQDVMVLAYLDRLYGNLFDVLFGLCKEEGIHLREDEKKLVLARMHEFDNTGRWDSNKSQPPAWEKFQKKHRRVMKNQRRAAALMRWAGLEN